MSQLVVRKCRAGLKSTEIGWKMRSKAGAPAGVVEGQRRGESAERLAQKSGARRTGRRRRHAFRRSSRRRSGVSSETAVPRGRRVIEQRRPVTVNNVRALLEHATIDNLTMTTVKTNEQ